MAKSPSREPAVDHAAGAGPGQDRLGAARILLVDGERQRLSLHRQWIEAAGGREPEIAECGDEALDILGATAQRFDLVALWPVLPDAQTVDLVGVLRRCHSPVRALAVTAFTPRELPRPGRLAGIAAVDDSGTSRGFIRAVRAVLASTSTIAEVVATKVVPRTLSLPWAHAVYGTRPGARFHGDLD